MVAPMDSTLGHEEVLTRACRHLMSEMNKLADDMDGKDRRQLLLAAQVIWQELSFGSGGAPRRELLRRVHPVLENAKGNRRVGGRY